MLCRFQEEYPAVAFDFYMANADDIKECLDKGLLDIGFLTEPADITKYNFIRLKKKGLSEGCGGYVIAAASQLFFLCYLNFL